MRKAAFLNVENTEYEPLFYGCLRMKGYTGINRCFSSISCFLSQICTRFSKGRLEGNAGLNSTYFSVLF